MAQRARAHYYKSTPTELLIVRGETDAGRELEIIINTDMALEIILQGAEAYKHCKHLGHALWHVKNDHMKPEDFENCSLCKNAKDEWQAIHDAAAKADQG